jgi:hypothetical protein
MTAIFISRSTSDVAHGKLVVSRLERLGYRSVFDSGQEEIFSAGDRWDQIVFECMRSTRVFLPLLSENWHRSPWSYGEFTLACFLEKKILPVAMSTVLDTRSLHPLLRQYQILRLAPDLEAGIRSLDRALRATGLDPRAGFKFKVFLSYSHENREEAEQLHRSLSAFTFPEEARGWDTELGPVPEKLGEIFLDRTHFGAERDLPESVHKALYDSEYLVVVCSPFSRTSNWVNQEVEVFQKNRDPGNILAVLVDAKAYGPSLSFPPSLTSEPLAPDLAQHGVATVTRRLASTMSGLSLAELEFFQQGLRR